MWTRKSVKQKGKKAFFGNFWKCVLVAIILSIVIGALDNVPGEIVVLVKMQVTRDKTKRPHGASL